MGGPMEIIKKYNDKELTVIVKNKMDTNTAPEFEKEIMAEMGNFDSLILDFTELEYISSAGLRVLIVCEKKLFPKNIPFIIKVNDSVKDILLIAGFDKLLKIE